MYRTADAPASGLTGTAFPLGLAGIVHRRFTDGATRVDDDSVVRHLSDLCAGYDVRYRKDIAARSTGNTFTAMAQDLVETMPTDLVDLVVVAHDTPDLDHRLAAATYLAEALPASSLTFTVSEGGSCTPYTALRLVGGYAERHGYQRALVLLMDQATLPYDTGMTLTGDAAVAILLERDCPTGLALRQATGVPAEDVPAALEDLLRAVAGPDEPVAVIAGTGVDPDRLPARAEAVWCAPTGYPCTATWEGLARHPGPDTGTWVVLADYEPRTGELSVCAVDRPWSVCGV